MVGVHFCLYLFIGRPLCLVKVVIDAILEQTANPHYQTLLKCTEKKRVNIMHIWMTKCSIILAIIGTLLYILIKSSSEHKVEHHTKRTHAIRKEGKRIN